MTLAALRFESPTRECSSFLCPKCDTVKEESEFYSRDGFPQTSSCKECKRKSNVEYQALNSESIKATSLEYRLSNKDRISASNRASRLKHFYGMTVDDYDKMLEFQGGKCKTCGTDDPSPNPNFSVDHDHSCCEGEKSCGECVRGLVCIKCNFVIGYVESYISIETMVSYLARQ